MIDNIARKIATAPTRRVRAAGIQLAMLISTEVPLELLQQSWRLAYETSTQKMHSFAKEMVDLYGARLA